MTLHCPGRARALGSHHGGEGSQLAQDTSSGSGEVVPPLSLLALSPLRAQLVRTCPQPADCSKNRRRVCPRPCQAGPWPQAWVDPVLRGFGGHMPLVTLQPGVASLCQLNSARFHPFHTCLWSPIHTPALCQIQGTPALSGSTSSLSPQETPAYLRWVVESRAAQGAPSGEAQGAPRQGCRMRLGLPHSFHSARWHPQVQCAVLGAAVGLGLQAGKTMPEPQTAPQPRLAPLPPMARRASLPQGLSRFHYEHLRWVGGRLLTYNLAGLTANGHSLASPVQTSFLGSMQCPQGISTLRPHRSLPLARTSSAAHPAR